MAKQTYKILGQLGFNKYDELLRDKIKHGDEFVTTEQIDELFPIESLVPLVPWSTGTDEEITAMINGYYNDLITLEDIKTVWHVGDTREVNITAMTSDYTPYAGTEIHVGESHEAQTIELVILDFEHDDIDGGYNYKNKALISVQTKDCLTNSQGIVEEGYMNSTNDNNTGWRNCARRKWCNITFFAALPLYLQQLIKSVNKKFIKGNTGGVSLTDTTLDTTIPYSDLVWLLSEKEVRGNTSYNSGAKNEGTQYEYYKLNFSAKKNNNTWWWTRSAAIGNYSTFCVIYDNGYGTSDSHGRGASYTEGLAPAFCL